MHHPSIIKGLLSRISGSISPWYYKSTTQDYTHTTKFSQVGVTDTVNALYTQGTITVLNGNRNTKQCLQEDWSGVYG